jgi:hypothetical protein
MTPPDTRSYVFSGDDLPMLKREQSFTAKDISRRERTWLKIQAKQIDRVLEYSGRGYEPPQGHLVPLSCTETQAALRHGL